MHYSLSLASVGISVSLGVAVTSSPGKVGVPVKDGVGPVNLIRTLAETVKSYSLGWISHPLYDAHTSIKLCEAMHLPMQIVSKHVVY